MAPRATLATPLSSSCRSRGLSRRPATASARAISTAMEFTWLRPIPVEAAAAAPAKAASSAWLIVACGRPSRKCVRQGSTCLAYRPLVWLAANSLIPPQPKIPDGSAVSIFVGPLATIIRLTASPRPTCSAGGQSRRSDEPIVTKWEAVTSDRERLRGARRAEAHNGAR